MVHIPYCNWRYAVEIWKEIEVRGHALKVSNLGRVHIAAKTTTFTYVRLGKRASGSATFKERILTPSKTQLGYMEVAFTHKRKRYRFLVHRLVATAFVLGYSDDKVVNHIDGDKLNNDPSNLEWITPGENSKHAWATDLIPIRGEKNFNARFNERQIRHIRKALARGFPVNSMAIITGVTTAAILKIRDRKTWAHVA